MMIQISSIQHKTNQLLLTHMEIHVQPPIFLYLKHKLWYQQQKHKDLNNKNIYIYILFILGSGCSEEYFSFFFHVYIFLSDLLVKKLFEIEFYTLTTSGRPIFVHFWSDHLTIKSVIINGMQHLFMAVPINRLVAQ